MAMWFPKVPLFLQNGIQHRAGIFSKSLLPVIVDFELNLPKLSHSHVHVDNGSTQEAVSPSRHD